MMSCLMLLLQASLRFQLQLPCLVTHCYCYSSPPSNSDSIQVMGRLLSGQPELPLSNMFGKGRASISPGMSQVGEVGDRQVVEESNCKPSLLETVPSFSFKR